MIRIHTLTPANCPELDKILSGRKHKAVIQAYRLMTKLSDPLNGESTPLNTDEIERIYGDAAYRRFCEVRKAGLAKSSKSYRQNEYCKSHWWTDKALVHGFEHKVWTTVGASQARKEAIKEIKAGSDAYFQSECTPAMEIINRNLQSFSLNIDIETFVDGLPDKVRIDGKTTNEAWRRECIKHSAYAANDKGLCSVHRSQHGRVFHVLTMLEKNVRGQLSVNGENTSERDLNASQWLFLAHICPILSLRDAVMHHEFYERINNELDESFDMATHRAQLKLEFMPWAFQGDLRFRNKDWFKDTRIAKAVENAYPGISEWVNDFLRANGVNSLIHTLQGAESEFFIDHMVPLADGHRMIVSTAHDSMIVGESQAGNLQDMLTSELQKKTGLNPLFS